MKYLMVIKTTNRTKINLTCSASSAAARAWREAPRGTPPSTRARPPPPGAGPSRRARRVSFAACPCSSPRWPAKRRDSERSSSARGPKLSGASGRGKFLPSGELLASALSVCRTAAAAVPCRGIITVPGQFITIRHRKLIVSPHARIGKQDVAVCRSGTRSLLSVTDGMEMGAKTAAEMRRSHDIHEIGRSLVEVELQLQQYSATDLPTQLHVENSCLFLWKILKYRDHLSSDRCRWSRTTISNKIGSEANQNVKMSPFVMFYYFILYLYHQLQSHFSESNFNGNSPDSFISLNNILSSLPHQQCLILN